MITNGNASVVIDGISRAKTVYKRNDEEIADGMFYVIDNEGNPLGTECLVVNGDIGGYIIKHITLHEASVYEISGIAIPGDITVYLSAGYQREDINFLKENVIASAYADAEGNFKFENIICAEGEVSMWMSIFPEEASVASLEYTLSVTDFDPYMGNLSTFSFSEPKGQYVKPFFTISGTCTYDITRIYLS